VQGPGAARGFARATATVLAVIAAWIAAIVSPASAGIANAGLAGPRHSDPIAGMPWGVYTGPQDEVFGAYEAATGRNRALLAHIALEPRARWFGAWYPDSAIEQTIRDYIANSTERNPDALSQLAVFRLVPWEHAACGRLPTAAEQASYKRWIQAAAAGIGSSRVALVLQPDLPFALCVPRHSTLPLRLVAYAAQTFTALTHTTVYIDVGAADWATIGQAVSMLRTAGIAGVRGFSLNATHYDGTQAEIGFGARLVRALAAAGVPERHFVINTSDNGRPFTYQQYRGSDFDNAAPCRAPTSTRCVTLGSPPTWQVTDTRWGLSAQARAVAAREVDGYLWLGRPWLVDQTDPFDLRRSLEIAATSPYESSFTSAATTNPSFTEPLK
jgi:endoglucanase